MKDYIYKRWGELIQNTKIQKFDNVQKFDNSPGETGEMALTHIVGGNAKWHLETPTRCLHLSFDQQFHL